MALGQVNMVEKVWFITGTSKGFGRVWAEAALARGDRVELRGFGAFSVKRRDARVGRNPRTGDSVPVAEKHIPFFKTGKQLRDRLNQSAA